MLKRAAVKAGSPKTTIEAGGFYAEKILGELSKELTAYVKSPPHHLYSLYQACAQRIRNNNVVSKLSLPVNLFHTIYVDKVLKEVNTNTKYELCYGCRYTDQFGFEGHPSQKHHPCLLNGDDINLANCWQKAHKQVRAEIVRDFIEVLYERPDIYLAF